MKTEKQERQAGIQRRAHIRRGMRIALYEINQLLAPKGMSVDMGREYIAYTVALAEGGRAEATLADKHRAVVWQVAAELAAKGQRVTVLDE